jgi:glycosyltransferase involved in cell wall biosynthesis
MKILLVNTHERQGGAARAAYRLYRAMRETGCDMEMLVRSKTDDDEHVITPGPPTTFRRILARLISDGSLLRRYQKRTNLIFNPAYFCTNTNKKIGTVSPDIIHLSWISQGFVGIEALKYWNRPIVWTLQDSWAFTGGCHIPFDCRRYTASCGACPALGSSKDKDLSRWVWKRKKSNWSKVNLTVVTPSRWMARCAEESSLFRDRRVEVIPNGLDLNRYKSVNKRVSRDILGLSQDKQLILFGAVNATRDPNKGFHLLKEALRYLNSNGSAEKAELLLFGTSENQNTPDPGMKCHFKGILQDDISLSVLYSAADIFVAPSIQDNLPNTVMEAMACGTPCIAFHIGGMPDLIDNQENGYLATPYDVRDLARGMSWLLSDNKRRQTLSQNARHKIESQFDIKIVARRYINLYREIAA